MGSWLRLLRHRMALYSNFQNEQEMRKLGILGVESRDAAPHRKATSSTTIPTV